VGFVVLLKQISRVLFKSRSLQELVFCGFITISRVGFYLPSTFLTPCSSMVNLFPIELEN